MKLLKDLLLKINKYENVKIPISLISRNNSMNNYEQALEILKNDLKTNKKSSKELISKSDNSNKNTHFDQPNCFKNQIKKFTGNSHRYSKSNIAIPIQSICLSDSNKIHHTDKNLLFKLKTDNKNDHLKNASEIFFRINKTKSTSDRKLAPCLSNDCRKVVSPIKEKKISITPLKMYNECKSEIRLNHSSKPIFSEINYSVLNIVSPLKKNNIQKRNMKSIKQDLKLKTSVNSVKENLMSLKDLIGKTNSKNSELNKNTNLSLKITKNLWNISLDNIKSKLIQSIKSKFNQNLRKTINQKIEIITNKSQGEIKKEKSNKVNYSSTALSNYNKSDDQLIGENQNVKIIEYIEQRKNKCSTKIKNY